MTTTTNPSIGRTWTEIADSANDDIVTVQNYAIRRLEYCIDTAATVPEDLRGIYIKDSEKEHFAGFEGKVRVRYPNLKDGDDDIEIGLVKS